MAESEKSSAPDPAVEALPDEVPGDGQGAPDLKAAYAAALERKKQAGQARAAHLDGHGGVGGATASHKATRTFRRKSG